MCSNCRSRGRALGQNRRNFLACTKLGLSDKSCAFKRLLVCSSWDVSAFSLANGLDLQCYQSRYHLVYYTNISMYLFRKWYYDPALDLKPSLRAFVASNVTLPCNNHYRPTNQPIIGVAPGKKRIVCPNPWIWDLVDDTTSGVFYVVCFNAYFR